MPSRKGAAVRVVVIGATGNVGTAVLSRLRSVPYVTELVGVARRLPDASVEPYLGVSWYSIDVADPVDRPRLERVLSGADAVIHLAWALQPNRDERAMRRTNVGGTAAVLAATAAVNVPHVLVASSVGAYSMGPKRRRVDENWPTGGIHTSHYSRHKAANERALDLFEVDHPEIVVTRLRPGLVFQRNAGLEVASLFLGSRFPTRWLKWVRPRVLPLPSQAIVQAVHARDLADAYWRAIDRRAAGAFNIAAEPVLDPAAIARAVGATRTIPIRRAVARLIVQAGWRLHVQAMDPGWLDIAVTVPVMSTDRARRELGWRPTVSSTDALAEIVEGMADRTRVQAAPPLAGSPNGVRVARNR